MQKVIVYYAFKIIDGLFVGNSKAPLERDFLYMNKINYIINCAASELTYNGTANSLSFDWKDTDDQLIVTIQNITTIAEFIDQANEQCEGVLFFSLKGQSRALTALTAYIMFKFNWSLFKTLQFLNSRRKDFEIRASFLKQLMTFEAECFKDKNISRNWDPSHDITDSQILQNTYLNSLQQQPLLIKTLTNLTSTYVQKRAISWSYNLAVQLETLDQKQPNNDIEYKSILKQNKIQQTKQHRSISVSDHQKNSFEDFILQNLLTTKKLQTPKITSFGFEQKNKKQFYTTQVAQSYKIKCKRPPPQTPERKRMIQNTQQILDTYLNCNINFVRGRSLFTPQSKDKEKIRALSQQTPSPNRTPVQSRQNMENMSFIRWSQVKRQAQFKIK